MAKRYQLKESATVQRELLTPESTDQWSKTTTKDTFTGKCTELTRL